MARIEETIRQANGDLISVSVCSEHETEAAARKEMRRKVSACKGNKSSLRKAYRVLPAVTA